MSFELHSNPWMERYVGALLSQGKDRLNRARNLLGKVPLVRLSRLSASELQSLAALSPLEARRLYCAFALGRLVEKEQLPKRPLLRKAKDVHAFMAPRLRGLQRERFVVLLLDVQNRLQEVCEISQGTLTSSLVHPREVFAPAIRASAASILVVHNHPSGDPAPSSADREVTRRLIRSGKLIGIPLLDHIVCGHLAWHSMRESMDFEEHGQLAAEPWL